jgi:hypothetical protein
MYICMFIQCKHTYSPISWNVCPTAISCCIVYICVLQSTLPLLDNIYMWWWWWCRAREERRKVSISTFFFSQGVGGYTQRTLRILWVTNYCVKIFTLISEWKLYGFTQMLCGFGPLSLEFYEFLYSFFKCV